VFFIRFLGHARRKARTPRSMRRVHRSLSSGAPNGGNRKSDPKKCRRFSSTKPGLLNAGRRCAAGRDTGLPPLEAILKDLDSLEYSRNEEVIYRLREYVLNHRNDADGRADTRKGCWDFW